MHADIAAYHSNQLEEDRQICDQLYDVINKHLPNAESKVWHAHPVWFIDGNPIVGYSKLKHDVRIMFWSGQSFDEPGLTPDGSFKAATVRYTNASQIKLDELERYLEKAKDIQWDYKNIIKNRGLLKLKFKNR